MNTKGIKFLAVLAVMVMAFAAIVVLAPADVDARSVNVGGFSDSQIDPTVITEQMTTETGGIKEFYISEDATVKITGLGDNITFYVQNGKELELNIKTTADLGKTITVYSVTSDLQKPTTSTVDTHAADPDTNGKVVLTDTQFTFTGVKGQSVSYLSLMPASVVTKYVNTTSIQTTVKTADLSNNQYYAYISSDATLAAPYIASLVTIAPGQYIETTGTITGGFAKYGVKVTDSETSNNTTTVTTTYFANGMDAGTIYMNESGDSVEVKEGSAIVKNGNNNVRAVSVKGDAIMTFATGQINVTGSFTGGTLTVSGKILFGNNTAAFAVGSAMFATGNVVIANGTDIVSGSAIDVYGTLTLKNTSVSNLTVKKAGTIIAQNSKLWSRDNSGVPYIAFAANSEFKGLIDVTAITETAEVKDRFATASIAQNQTFVVVADTTVTTSLDVYGVLIINPGVTLTISKSQIGNVTTGARLTTSGQYAQIINNGTILIKTTGTGGLFASGGSFVNNGAITGSSDANTTGPTLSVSVNPAGSTAANYGRGFENNGSVMMAKKDLVSITNGFTNKGSVTINGGFSGATTITNKGIITLANAEIASSLSVKMSKGATFNVNSAVLGETESITIFDGTSTSSNNASITITAPAVPAPTNGDDPDALFTIRGLYVEDTDKKLDLSGAMGVVRAPTSVTEDVALTLAGAIDVTESANIPKGFALTYANATITVSGDLTVGKDVAATGQTTLNLIIKEDGVATSLEGDVFSGCSYAAAKFTLSSGTTIYTGFENAVEAAATANINTIDVGSIPGAYPTYVTITSDVVIPSGMIVSGSTIVIGDYSHAPLLSISPSALFTFTDVILEEGMIYASNANDIDDSSVHADVKEESDDGSVKYKSIGVAILMAGEDDVIILNQDVVITDETFIIPEGITISGIDEEQQHAIVFINSDLVVNGLLVVDDFHFIATIDDTKEIILNGTIMDVDSDGDSITPWWYTPVGVSYNMTVEDEYGNEEVWYVITNLDNLQEAIWAADDSKVAIEGNAKLGDVTISGTEDEPAEVTFKGNVSAGTLTLDNAVIIAQDGKKVTATFADAIGSITITGAYVKNELAIYSVENTGVYMAGAVTDCPNGTYSIRFDGITGIDGTTKTAIGWGTYAETPVVYPTILFNGTTTAVGKKVLIQNDTVVTPSRANAGVVTIAGSLIADNGTKIIIDADTEVLGALVASDRGGVEINGHLFVGATIAEIYSADAAIAASNANEFGGRSDYNYAEYGQHVSKVLGDSTVLSGKIEVGNAYFITVMDGSDVDPAIVEDMSSVDVIIEGVKWITVYGTANYSLDGLMAPIFNAKVDKILDADGNEIAYFDHNYKVIYGSIAKPIAQYSDVYISLNYEAFTVKIKTDGSVKAVYIDGILMETGQSENIFTLKNQTTGTHKVTVEAATGYDAAKCVLYTEMGTILPGMAFTFTEFDCDNYVVTYNINGTEIQPEPVPPAPEEESQWTITTILLVILVVLIAIMAVIVALRLNRS